MRISDKQIIRLQELYKKHFNVDLTFDEAADVARRLATIFLPRVVDDSIVGMSIRERNQPDRP